MPKPMNAYAALRADPCRFHFFAACRAIECAHPDLPLLGTSTRLKHDPVRLGQHVTLAFAPAMVESFRQEGGVPRLAVNFFGLLGPNGPLPLHLTEYVFERAVHADDHTLAAFLDVFHHRLLSLFYRGWRQAQPVVTQDRPEKDRFRDYLGAFLGMAFGGAGQGEDVARKALLRHAGRLLGPRSADGLRNLIADTFKVRVEVQEFVPHWEPLHKRDQLRLTSTPRAARLGVDTVIGRQMLLAQDKFCLHMGPLPMNRIADFLPGGRLAQRLVDRVLAFAGPSWRWEVRFRVPAREIPPLRLGRQARLGWTSWLGPITGKSHDTQLCLSSTQLGRYSRESHQ